MKHDNIILKAKEFPGEIKYGNSTATKISSLLIVDYHLSRKRVDVYKASDFEPVEATSKEERTFDCAAVVVSVKGFRPVSMNNATLVLKTDELNIVNAAGSVSYPVDVVSEISMYLD